MAKNQTDGQEKLNIKLLAATKSGSLKRVKDLLDRGADPNACIADCAWDGGADWTALHMAAANVERVPAAVVELLLDNGARVDVEDDIGMTPLHWAAKYNGLKFIDLFLDAGAEIDAVSKWGNTPLSLTLHDSTRTARHLIKRGADPFKTGKDPQEIIDFFKGDIDWMPEDVRTKLKNIMGKKSS